MIKKFRAWDKRTEKFCADKFHILGEITCFDLIGQYLNEHKEENETTFDRLNDIEIDQYIDLSDKEGNEICENNIYKYYNIIVIIKYKEGSFQAISVKNKYNYFILNKIYAIKMKYLGNKYENKELLK